VEENERKSKMPVKPIVAGLFILAAVSVLAYAGYVYHRNSQRDEALAFAKSIIDLWGRFDTGNGTPDPHNSWNDSFDTAMKIERGCSIKLDSRYSQRSPDTNHPNSYLSIWTVQDQTCHLNLGELSASEVRLEKVESEKFPLPDNPLFVPDDSASEGYPYWILVLSGKRRDVNVVKCEVHDDSHRSESDSYGIGIPIHEEDSANRAANAFKVAIRLCGGKDEPF
jgi:hypothetical protein